MNAFAVGSTDGPHGLTLVMDLETVARLHEDVRCDFALLTARARRYGTVRGEAKTSSLVAGLTMMRTAFSPSGSDLAFPSESRKPWVARPDELEPRTQIRQSPPHE